MTAAHPELPRPTVAEPAFAAAMEKGMNVALWAQRLPHAPAVISATGNRTYGELNQRCNQLVRALRAHGVGAGDGVALVVRQSHRIRRSVLGDASLRQSA